MTPAPSPARAAGLIAGLTGAAAVAFGAFGAHGLKASLSPEALAWWQTGALYHLLHALALLGLAVLFRLRPANRLLRLAFWLFFAGICVFAGSLYAMALTDLRVLGAITPIGGTSLIVAWVLTGVGLSRPSSPEESRP